MATGYEPTGPRPMDPALSAWPSRPRVTIADMTFPDPQPLDLPASIVMLRQEIQSRLRPSATPFVGSLVDLSV